MESLSWLFVNNITLSGNAFKFANEKPCLSLLLLPLSISTILTFSKIRFPVQTRIIHHSPLLISRCQLSEGASFELSSFSEITINETNFNTLKNTLTSKNSESVTIKNCRFNSSSTTIVDISNSKKVRIKKNSFNQSGSYAPIHLTYVSDAIFTNNNFTGLNSGSIVSDSTNLYIGSCIFRNVSADNGGALRLSNSTSTIVFSFFQFCSAKTRGGSIYNEGGNLRVDSCIFTSGKATEGYSMYSTGGYCFIENCHFSGNFEFEISGKPIQKFNNTFASSVSVIPMFVTPSATFTPSPSMSSVPFTSGPGGDGWTRNTKIIVGCGCGIGGCIIIIVVCYIVYTKVKQINSSRVYVAESTNENHQPTGTTFVSKTYALP